MSNSSISAADVKAAASGSWLAILEAAGIPRQLLDGHGHPCPRCGGDDRFVAFKDVADTGGVHCRQCFSSGNDGLATIRWWLDCSFPEAIDFVASHIQRGLGVGKLSAGHSAPYQPSELPQEILSDGLPRQQSWSAEEAIAKLSDQFGRPPDHKWDYRTSAGAVCGKVLRWNQPDGKKDIRPVSLHNRTWSTTAMPEPRPLYGLPEIAGAAEVWVLEGEKCADLARSQLDVSATTSAGGSGAARKSDWSVLAAKTVFIVPDNDEPGEKYMSDVISELAGLTPQPTVRVVRLRGIQRGEDFEQWLGLHDAKTPEELVELLRSSAEPVVLQGHANSRSPKERGRARIEFRPIPCSELGSGEQLDWLWEGWIAKGFTTLLIGLWKAGKSTLVAHLLKTFAAGGLLAGQVRPARVLVVTEEGAALWARRRDDLGIGDHVHFEIRPFKGRPSQADWKTYVDQIAAAVARGEYELVIFDTWSSCNPVPDENDAQATMAALGPLNAITEVGGAVLIIHHPRKGDAAEGQACRGSGALPGFVDVIMELRRFQPDVADDRRRKIKGISRFDETPTEIVVELDATGYRVVGSTADAKRADRLEVAFKILADGVARSVDDILSNWPEDGVVRPGKRSLQSDLADAATQGEVLQHGKGTKGSPFTYEFDSRRDPLLGAARIRITDAAPSSAVVEPGGVALERVSQHDQPRVQVSI